jgi:hypothetical protein
MIIIAHRGNLDGRKPDRENEPFYIDNAIDAGFYVEIDVWSYDNAIYLGHDEPQYVVDDYWIEERRDQLFIHQKNIECSNLPCLMKTHRFTHHNDDFAITSLNVGWTVKQELLTENTIWVINENIKDLTNINCLGICTDYANHYSSL